MMMMILDQKNSFLTNFKDKGPDPRSRLNPGSRVSKHTQHWIKHWFRSFLYLSAFLMFYRLLFVRCINSSFPPILLPTSQFLYSPFPIFYIVPWLLLFSLFCLLSIDSLTLFVLTFCLFSASSSPPGPCCCCFILW